MNKKFQKIVAVGLSALTIATASMPVYAATSYKNSTASVVEDINGADIKGNDTNQNKKTKYSEYSEDTATATDVYVSQKSTFSVVAPVVAILNGKAGEANTGDVRYRAFGNIASDEVITVEPDDTFFLSQAGKDDILCTVEAKNAITDFTYANGIRPDNALTRDFTITANNMTAGSWHGSYNTNISLDSNPIPEGYTTLYEYDLSATENDNVKAYYAVPTRNTTPIDVGASSETASANLVSSIANLFTPMTAYAAIGDVIEYNGVRYELSDEDTLIVSGTGEMKENIQADLIDYEGIKNDTISHFEETLGKIENYQGIKAVNGKLVYKVSDTNAKYIFHYFTNNAQPDVYKVTGAVNGLDGYVYAETTREEPDFYMSDLEKDIEKYVESIKSNYITQMPKNVVIRNGVTNISNGAFCNCKSLQNVEIADTVTSIDNSAFKNCSGLTNITIPGNVTNIGEYSFASCGALKSVTFDEGVISIGNYAFSNCYQLNSVTIPNTVKSIGNSAFYGSNLSEITVPNTVVYIGNSAFTNVYNLIYNGTATGSPWGAKVVNGYIENNMIFADSTKSTLVYVYPSVTEITIPNSVTTVKRQAALYCSSAKTVKIPNSVTNIGDSAFIFMPSNSTIYCQSQAVADLLVDYNGDTTHGNYSGDKTTVVVDASKF